MGRKRDTLLRWVNCCYDSGAPFERLHELSNGIFFLHILSVDSNHLASEACPWVTISKILKDRNITEDMISFNAAALGDEEEIAKLIAICMHLTMVLSPREDIKEKTMHLLSTEDQLVIKAILHAIVNDDQMTRHQLSEIVYDPMQVSELNFSRGPCTFYTSSPASSVGRNSPLKRYLDSPMALRLSRLQREMNEKNEEIRRLQSEMMSESDENTLLRQRLDDLQRKYKEMEKKNAELIQRLDDCRQLENSLSCQSSDAELSQIKKQLKRLQSDYESTSQKYCDLNIAHEHLIGQRDKDRKQMRQVQNELNEELARLQREMAEMQLQLDTYQTENMELKLLVEEKRQWIDVLEDQNRTYAAEHCTASHLTTNVPRSPSAVLSPTKERESIGFTLLSLEVEKLQNELTANRTELFVEKEKFKSEKEVFNLQEQSLQQEINRVSLELADANRSYQELQQTLNQAQLRIKELSDHCHFIQQEKNQVSATLESLRSDANEQQHLIRSLEHKLEDTLKQRDTLDQQVEQLETDKVQLMQRITALQQDHLDALASLDVSRNEFNRELERINAQLLSNRQQMAQQAEAIQETQEQLQRARQQTENFVNEAARWEAETHRMKQHSSDLESQLQRTTDHFQTQLSTAHHQIQSTQNLLAQRDLTIQTMQSDLDDKHRLVELHSQKLTELEIQKHQLYIDISHQQEEMNCLKTSSESMQLQLRTDLEVLRQQHISKEAELLERSELIKSMQVQHSELMRRQEELSAVIADLEKEKEQQISLRMGLEQQLCELLADVQNGRDELASTIEKSKSQLELLDQKIRDKEEKSSMLENQLTDVTSQRGDLQSRCDQLQTERASLKEQVALLEQEKTSAESASVKAAAEFHEQMRTVSDRLESTQQQFRREEEASLRLQTQLDDISRQKDALQSSYSLLEEEKIVLHQKMVTLEADKADIEAAATRTAKELQNQLTRAAEELEAANQQLLLERKALLQVEAQLDEKIKQANHLQTLSHQLEEEKEHILGKLTQLEAEKNHVETSLLQTTTKYQSQLSEASVEIEAAKQQLRLQKEASALIESQLEDSIRQNENFQGRCNQLEEERAALIAKTVVLEEEKARIENSFTVMTTDFQNRLVEASEQLEAAHQLQLQKDIETGALQGQLEGQQQQQQDLQVHLNRIETEKGQLKEQVAILEEEKARVESSLIQISDQFKKEIHEAADHLEKTRHLLTQEQHKSATVQAELNILSERSELAKMENDTLKQHIADLEQEKVTVESSLLETTAQFQTRFSDATEQLELTRHLLMQQQEQLTSIQTQLSHLLDRSNSLETEKESLLQQIAVLESDKKEMQSSSAQLVDELQNRLAGNSDQLEVNRQLLVQKGEQLALAQTQLDDSLKRIEILEANNGKLVERVSLLQEQKVEIESSLSKLTSDFQQLSSQKDCFQKKIDDLQETISVLETRSETEITNLNIELQSKEEKEIAHTELIGQLETQLGDAIQSKNSLEEQMKSQAELIRQHSEATEQLSSRIESNLRVQSDLQRNVRDLECTRDRLEASLAETLDSNADALTRLQTEIDEIRSQLKSSEIQLAQQTELLTATEEKWSEVCDEKQSRIDSLSLEITTLTEGKKNLEEEHAIVRSQLNGVQCQLAEQEKTVRQKEDELGDLRRQKERLERLYNELQLERNSLEEQRSSIGTRVVELESSGQNCRTAYEIELNNLRTELDSRQKQTIEQAATISTMELELQNSGQLFRNLETMSDTLQTEIQEMKSQHREELIRLRSSLEAAQLENLTRTAELTAKVHAKESELLQQSEQIKKLQAQRSRFLQDQITLEQKMAVLESDNQVLRVVNEESRRSSRTDINQLEEDLQKNSMEQFNSISSMESEVASMSEALEDVQRKLNSVVAEKQKLSLKCNQVEQEKAKLKEVLESNRHQYQESLSCAHQNLEGKEREIIDLMDQLKSVTSQLAATSKSNGELEEKRRQMEGEIENLLRQKSTLEDSNLQVTSARRDLETQLTSARQEVEAKLLEIRLGREEIDRLRAQLSEAVLAKEALEKELSQRSLLQVSEKDNLSQRNLWLEEELARTKSAHQSTKTELETERASLTRIRTELSLEHRKEKAALEARLQLSQTQVKSMQEKLVSLTFTNKSHAQSQLQHKISVLTTELEATNTSKIDLEKKLRVAEDRLQQEMIIHKDRKPKAEEQVASRESNLVNQSELAKLRQQNERLNQELSDKKSIIDQCNVDLNKLKAHVTSQQEMLETLSSEKKKLTFEIRTLKTEQQFLLAQNAAEKDRANARNSRLSMAMQRGSSSSDGGSVADSVLDARRRSLRPSRSEITSRQLENEVFKPPRVVLADNNSTFKVPSISSSRRDSTSSIASNRSDASTTSRNGPFPHGAGKFFMSEDEDGELFSSSYLNEMKEGKCRMEDPNVRRMSELHRRNTLQPPHMRSAYPTELNDERLRRVDMPIVENPNSLEPEFAAAEAEAEANECRVQELAKATSLLTVNTPPAMNTRKRRSWHITDMVDTPVASIPSKRRSVDKEVDDRRLSIDSTRSDTRSIASSQGSAERNRAKRRESNGQTNYQRPGPPTPARSSSMKENILSTPSMSSPPKDTPKSQKSAATGGSNLSQKNNGGSPQSNRSVRLTPASVVRKIQSKLRSNKQSASVGEGTPGRSTTPRGHSKLNIFRKPLGSRGHNSSDIAKF